MTAVARRRSPFADFVNWFDSEAASLTSAYPRLEVLTNDDTYIVRAELPGVSPDDIDVTVDDDVLVIKAERREGHQEKDRSEFRYGSVSRVVPLPTRARGQEVTASYADGVLEMRVPLADVGDQPKHVSIERATA